MDNNQWLFAFSIITFFAFAIPTMISMEMNKKTFDKITPKDYDAFINVFENPEFRIGYIKSIQHGIFYSLWNFGKPFSYYNVPETVDMNIVEIVRKEIYKGNVRCK